MLIDGKKIAAEIITELKTYSAPKKFLAAVWVGSNSASESFLKQKEKVAHELGVVFRLFRFPETITTEALRAKIKKLGDDKSCGGIILQLPLPIHIDRDGIINGIPAEKDVDALSGKNNLLPPAVGVVTKILAISPQIRGEAVAGEASLVPPAGGSTSRGSRAASVAGTEERSVLLGFEEMSVDIVGLGFLTGAPIAKWLNGKVKNLVVVDKGDDFNPLKDADIVISGVGAPGLIQPEMLKPSAIGIDFGYGIKDGHAMGDFDPVCADICSVFTPTPGGTGPILVARLFTNFYTLYEAHNNN